MKKNKTRKNRIMYKNYIFEANQYINNFKNSTLYLASEQPIDKIQEIHMQKPEELNQTICTFGIILSNDMTTAAKLQDKRPRYIHECTIQEPINIINWNEPVDNNTIKDVIIELKYEKRFKEIGLVRTEFSGYEHNFTPWGICKTLEETMSIRSIIRMFQQIDIDGFISKNSVYKGTVYSIINPNKINIARIHALR